MLNLRFRSIPTRFRAVFARSALCTAVILGAAGIGACTKDYTAIALTSTSQLVQFQTNTPTQITTTVLLSTTGVLQIAYAPAATTGLSTLYCITSNNEVCTIDPSSGLVTVVGTAFTTDILSSQALGYDPVSNELRITALDSTSSTGRVNFRVSTAGARVQAAQYTSLSYASSSVNGTPQIRGLTYTNPVVGAGSTTLYGLDVNSQNLVRIGDTNVADPTIADAGSVNLIGPLDLNFSANLGFAISPQDGTAFAVLAPEGAGAQLYTIDLSTGAPTLVGTVGASPANYTLVSLAIAPP